MDLLHYFINTLVVHKYMYVGNNHDCNIMKSSITVLLEADRLVADGKLGG